jgi:hypothetical protein
LRSGEHRGRFFPGEIQRRRGEPDGGRKVEVWIDGKKMSQQLKQAFSYYSFLDASYGLSTGKHNVTVFSAAWDNLLEKFSFPLTVGSSTCAFPASVEVNISSPLNNAIVGSSVLAWASGTVTGTAARTEVMEVWSMEPRRRQTWGRTLKTTLSLASGTHKFTYFIVNTAGQKVATEGVRDRAVIRGLFSGEGRP